MPAYDPELGQIRDGRRLHNTAWQISYEHLQHEHHQRKRRIYNQFTDSQRRAFAASALSVTSGEGFSDVDVLKKEGYLVPGSTSVYYADGAYCSLEEYQHGLLAAAITAAFVIQLQLREERCGQAPPKYDLPAWVQSLARDVREEALWRLRQPFFRWESGNCWIAPTLQLGNSVKRYLEEEEEDWTVYRLIMTLKEAQEADARESRRYLNEKDLETRDIPRKEHTEEEEVRKAAPLRNIWRQTKALLKQSTLLDYSEMYRKCLEK
jgi:hypothetical protein